MPCGPSQACRAAMTATTSSSGRSFPWQQSGASVAKPPQSASFVHAEFEAYTSLAGLIDREAELKRAEKQLAEVQRHLQGAEAKLGNASFVDKAPPEVVQQQRDLVAELKAKIKALEENLGELRGS